MRSILYALGFSALLTSLPQVSAASDGEIVQFSQLPQCAQWCGPLYDVQGKCAPPKLSSVDKSCFCSDSRLAGFLKQSTVGVCDYACHYNDLLSIQSWVIDYCSKDEGATSTSTHTTSTSTKSSKPTGTDVEHAPNSSETATTDPGTTKGQIEEHPPWIKTHYRWVIMIVILVVAIIGGWIAACYFRRRYLRKREESYEMHQPDTSWITGPVADPQDKNVGVVETAPATEVSGSPPEEKRGLWRRLREAFK